jgi:hypothetical protein
MNAAKDFMLVEQGLKRANDPIRSYEELESGKDLLEDGYYLGTHVSLPGDTSLDICKLSSTSVTNYFGYVSNVKTLKRCKRMFILNLSCAKIVKS